MPATVNKKEERYGEDFLDKKRKNATSAFLKVLEQKSTPIILSTALGAATGAVTGKTIIHLNDQAENKVEFIDKNKSWFFGGTMALGLLFGFSGSVAYFANKRGKRIGAEEGVIKIKLDDIKKLELKIENLRIDITLSDEQKKQRIIALSELLKDAIEEYNALCKNVSK